MQRSPYNCTDIEEILITCNVCCVYVSGNSQYHYYGIRIKSMSPLNQVGCDGLMLSRQHVFSQAKRYIIVCSGFVW